MVAFPELSAIFKSIQSFKDIIKQENYISVPDLDFNDVPVKLSFEGNSFNLRGYVITTMDNYHKIQDISGKIIACDFSGYKSSHAFVLSYGGWSSDNPLETSVSFSLNDITYGSPTDVNIAVFNSHHGIKELSQYIAFGYVQGDFSFNGIRFHIYLENKHIVLVSYEKIPELEFVKYIYAVKNALDFLICETAGGTAYILSTTAGFKKVDYLKVQHLSRGSRLDFHVFMGSIFPLIDMFDKNNEISLRRLSIEQFERLCALLYDKRNNQLQTAVHYILESANLWAEYRMSFLSISLEALSKFEKEDTQLIKDKDVFNKIKERIKEAILSFHGTIDDNCIGTIVGKVSNLNNSLSNADTLLLPFEKYKVPLTEDDKKMFNSRNKILHGNAPEYTNDINFDILKYQKESWRFYHVLYCLILKIIGYNGFIININEWRDILAFDHAFRGSKEDEIYKPEFFTNLGEQEKSIDASPQS